MARDDDSQPIVVEVEQEPIAPQMDDDAVQAVIDDLNAVTSVPMTVVVNGQHGRHRPGVGPVVAAADPRPPMTDEPTYAVDQESALASLGRRCPRSVRAPVDARFDLVGGQVVLSPSQDGTGCCADDTAARILQSLQQGAHSVTLELGTDPARSDHRDGPVLGHHPTHRRQPGVAERAARPGRRPGSRRSTPPARPGSPTSTASPTSSEGR